MFDLISAANRLRQFIPEGGALVVAQLQREVNALDIYAFTMTPFHSGVEDYLWSKYDDWVIVVDGEARLRASSDATLARRNAHKVMRTLYPYSRPTQNEVAAHLADMGTPLASASIYPLVRAHMRGRAWRNDSHGIRYDDLTVSARAG